MTTNPLRWFAALSRGVLTIIGVLIIVYAVLTLGARAGLPFVSGYTGDIEAGLSDYLGQPVSVERLEFRWRGSGPELRATGLVVGAGAGPGTDAGAGGERIAIAEALIDVDVLATAWRFRPVLNELTLVGVDLALERDAAGALRVRGLDAASPAASSERADAGGGLLDAIGWLFDARRVGLVDARLELLDRQQSEGFTFAELNLSVENDGDSHRLRVDVDLPKRLGGQLALGIDLGALDHESVSRAPEQIRVGDLSGAFDLRSDRLDITQIARLLATWDIAGFDSLAEELPGGMLALDLNGSLEQGRIERLNGRLKIDSLVAAARAAQGGIDAEQPSALPDTLSLPIALSRNGNDWSLVADGTKVSRADVALSVDTLRVRQEGDGWRVDAAAATPAPLDLAVSLADLLPVSLFEAAPGAAALSWLDRARPHGMLSGWQLSFDSQGAALAAAVDLDALAFEPVGHAPGVKHLDVTLRLGEGAGTIDLSPTPGELATLTPASAYSQPLVLSKLDAELQIETRDAHAQTPGLRLSGPVSFESGTLSADSRFTLVVDDVPSPWLDLRGRFALGDVTELAGLLPDRLLGAETVDWFRRAFVSGAARDGDLLWFGRIADFPYDAGDGVFRATLQADEVTLDWAEDWPAARALQGTVTFDGAAFEARTASGAVDVVDIARSRIAIDDLREGQLSVVASGTGPLPGMLDFATGGPLASILEPALGDTSGAGLAGLDLDVRVPLSDRARARHGPLSVDGSVFLDGNAIAFARADVALEGVTGGIGFDEAGAHLHRVEADWLGQPIRLDAQTQGQGAARQMTLSLSGALHASDVLAHYGLPLDRYVRGASLWNATLAVPFDTQRLRQEGVTLSATSELVGTELLLPAPLAKTGSPAERFTVSSAFRVDEPTVRWRVEHDRSDGTSGVSAIADVADGRLLALALGIGARQANSDGLPGIRVDGEVATLDADGWGETLAQLIEDIMANEDEHGGTGTGDGSGHERGDQPILPVSGDIDVARLELRDASLGPARLQLHSDEEYLNAVLDNEHVEGNVQYPRQRARLDGSLRPIRARLTRVDTQFIDALLGEAEAVNAEASSEAASGPDPRALPPIEAHVGRLRYNDLDLDGLMLRTAPASAGLDIEALGFTHRNLQLSGEGRWFLTDPPGFEGTLADEHVTNLSLTLQSGNFEAGLADIGLQQLLGDTAGRALASLSWTGPAWRPDVATLDGNVEIAFEHGRVVPLEPGAGKLIGLFAFQALPRRLSLDFSDVVLDGLAFNTLKGRATLQDGVLETSLLELTGPVGVIDVVGTTDLVARTFDQQVTVLPRVSAALPIIGAISGGASAGLTVLIAGGLLKALGVDFDRIGLREYHLIGSWDEPELVPSR